MHDAPMTLGEALRKARSRMTQEDLAEAIGWPRKSGQSRLSSMENDAEKGTVTVRDFLADLRRIEDVTGHPHGWILQLAGYVDPTLNVEDAIRADPALSDDQRTMILTAYRALIDLNRKEGRTAEKRSRRRQ